MQVVSRSHGQQHPALLGLTLLIVCIEGEQVNLFSRDATLCFRLPDVAAATPANTRATMTTHSSIMMAANNTSSARLRSSPPASPQDAPVR
jgi:hypothetical protein